MSDLDQCPNCGERSSEMADESSERVIPQCPADDCKNREFEKDARFGNLSCTKCGYMPRFPLRDDIREALGMETIRRS